MPVRAFAAAGGILASTIAAGANAAPLEPTGNWIVDYADNMCVVQREYGTAAARLTLAIKPRPMSKTYDVYVLDNLTKTKTVAVPATVEFGRGEVVPGKYVSSYYVPKLSARVNLFILDRAELDRATTSEALSIQSKTLSDAFHLPKFREVMLVLDDCVADLLATWGFSREQQKAMSKPPEAIVPFYKVLSGADYPIEALRNEETGSNSARFGIDSNGKVSDCRIVESSNSKALDRTLCNAVHRMRFRPALDQQGKPMESVGFERAIWEVL